MWAERPARGGLYAFARCDADAENARIAAPRRPPAKMGRRAGGGKRAAPAARLPAPAGRQTAREARTTMSGMDGMRRSKP
eukprot:gene3211-2783_t